MKIVECVPNFSEGRNREVINKISDVISCVPGVTLLDVDSGCDTNRTVYTFLDCIFILVYNNLEILSIKITLKPKQGGLKHDHGNRHFSRHDC
ncbi:hypothetical protein ES703_69535 [subsurface metagenome]